MQRYGRMILALTGFMVLVAGSAASTPEAPSGAAPTAITVLSTTETILGQAISYPAATPARVTAVIVTLPPDASTGWHHHEVPLFGYMLDGELTVDYRGQGQRVYHAGDARMEAIDTTHDGRNTGVGPVRIVAVFMGAEGVPNTERPNERVLTQ